MIHKTNIFILRDNTVWDIEDDFIILSDLLRQGGVLFWCRNGEWRAIGGPRLVVVVENLRQHVKIRRAYVTADLAHMAPDQARAYDEWDNAIPVPAEVVRWLRDETEQLSETDASTESATE